MKILCITGNWKIINNLTNLHLYNSKWGLGDLTYCTAADSKRATDTSKWTHGGHVQISPIFSVYEKASVVQKEQSEKKGKENFLCKTKGDFVYKHVWDKAMSTV